MPGKAEGDSRPPRRSLGLSRRWLCISDGSSIQHVSCGPAAQSSGEKSSSGEKQGLGAPSYGLFPHSLRGRALSRPAGFSGSPRSSHCTEAEERDALGLLSSGPSAVTRCPGRSIAPGAQHPKWERGVRLQSKVAVGASPGMPNLLYQKPKTRWISATISPFLPAETPLGQVPERPCSLVMPATCAPAVSPGAGGLGSPSAGREDVPGLHLALL